MSIYGGPDIVTDGLVLHLDAANSKSYSGSGNTWFDLSGNNNHGTLTNGPTYSSNNKGSIVFDGTNDYTLLNSIISTKPFCLSFWARLNTIKNQCFYSSRTAVGQGISVFALGMSAGSNVIRFDTGDTIHQWNIGYAIPINVWVSLIFQVTNSTKEFYVNGSFISSVAFTAAITNISPTIATIGASQISGTTLDNYLAGNIAQVSIYNRSLTSAEALKNYNATKGRYNL